MPDTPTLAQLILAYDRMKAVGADYERLHRGGLITLQGVLTQEGERALLDAYRSLVIDQEAALKAAFPAVERMAAEEKRGNRAARAVAGKTAPQSTRWTEAWERVRAALTA